jgi:hypothetical protein
MRVQIKDLKPNPYRDIKNYPINEEKVQSLINSINQTGFWDNILGRQNNDYIEIAYGHHRLVALQKIFKPEDFVDIPVKDLDDSMMIKIMANENDESWGTSPQIIDETVRVTKKFLEEHPGILRELGQVKKSGRMQQDFMVGEVLISRFLDGNWNRYRIKYSLERLGLIESGEIDKESIESMPSGRAAIDFVKAVKQIKNVTPEQQKKAAKKIVDTQSYGESAVKSALLDEKYKHRESQKDKEEKQTIELKSMLTECTKYMNGLNAKFMKLYTLQEKYGIDFSEYKDTEEAQDFESEMIILFDWLKKFAKRGGEKHNGEIQGNR